MKWNVEEIAFLYPPDVFTGSFDNAKMQQRHEKQVQEKLEGIMMAIEGESDPLAAMKKLNSRDHIQFLRNNQVAFEDAERLEEVVLFLYARLNAPFASGGDAAIWNSLFESCDKTKMYRLGTPVSFSTATVYRGSISGFMRSLSWTPDRNRAEKFARRWHDPSLGGGELYEVDITRANILIYIKHPHEGEILVDPTFIQTADIRPFTISR